MSTILTLVIDSEERIDIRDICSKMILSVARPGLVIEIGPFPVLVNSDDSPTESS